MIWMADGDMDGIEWNRMAGDRQMLAALAIGNSSSIRRGMCPWQFISPSELNSMVRVIG